jgi:tRNA A37 threonylcarbamoyladenosine synthetase subunit TsaC/SUA5/YrdC
MSSTLILPDIDLPLNDPEDICERLEKSVDIIITSGSCGIEPTTVVDLTDSIPRLLRAGKGDTTDIR